MENSCQLPVASCQLLRAACILRLLGRSKYGLLHRTIAEAPSPLMLPSIQGSVLSETAFPIPLATLSLGQESIGIPFQRGVLALLRCCLESIPNSGEPVMSGRTARP